MKIKASELFNTEDKKCIADAIKKAETNTSGEVAIMVVDSSDSYREAETLGAILLSGFFSLILETIRSYLVVLKAADWGYSLSGFSAHILSEAAAHTAVWTYIPIVFLLYFPFRLLIAKTPEMKIPFLSGKRIEETVKERAIMAFYEKQLYKTRDETGILIFISLLEHRVWILGDSGINAKIAPDFWSKIANELSIGIRNKEYGKSVCVAIGKCGEELSRHFPRKSDDINEIADELIL